MMSCTLRSFLMLFAILLANTSGAASALTDAARLAIAEEAAAAYTRALAERHEDEAAFRTALREVLRRTAQIRADGAPSGSLLLLEGNAHSLLGDHGRAIAAYREGLAVERQSMTRHQLAQNLATVRQRVIIRPELGTWQGASEAWQRWCERRTAQRVMITLLVSWSVLWLTAAVPLSRMVRRLFLLGTSGLVVATAATAFTPWWIARGGEPAVLVGSAVEVRSGPGAMFEPIYARPLSGGVEVRLAEGRPDWVRVVLPDRLRGWVPEEAVVRIATLPESMTEALRFDQHVPSAP